MNSKGELSDVIVFVITVFILAVGLFILAYISPQIFNGLENSAIGENAEAQSAIQNTQSTLGLTINSGFLILFSGLVLSMFITSFMVRTHPIFMFLYIFFTIVSIIIALYIGNAYYDLQTNPLFADNLENSTFINVIMNYIVEITLAVAAISMVIMFSKFSTYGGTQPF